MRLKDADKLIELIDDDIASLDMNMPTECYYVCLCTLQMVKLYIEALPTVEPVKMMCNGEHIKCPAHKDYERGYKDGQAEAQMNADPKHGRWETCESGHDAVCTNCRKYWIPIEDKYDYWFCPRCGAKMDGTNKSVESVDLGNGFSISVNKSQFDTQGRYCPECLYSPTCYGAGISKPACKAFVPRVRYVDVSKDEVEE